MNELILILSLIAQPSERAPSSKPAMEQFVSIRVGATLKEAIVAFGKPFQAKEASYYDGTPYLQLIYVSDVCAGTSCSVIVEDGKVVKFMGVKPALTM